MTSKQEGNASAIRFRRFAAAVADAAGTPGAFTAALAVIALWAGVGPLFAYSDTWQLVINTGTTIVTFLMVFLIQATQNRDARAIHLKLDELIRAQAAARNVFADLEDATDEEILRFQDEFKRLRQTGMNQTEAAGEAIRSSRVPER